MSETAPPLPPLLAQEDACRILALLPRREWSRLRATCRLFYYAEFTSPEQYEQAVTRRLFGGYDRDDYLESLALSRNGFDAKIVIMESRRQLRNAWLTAARLTTHPLLEQALDYLFATPRRRSLALGNSRVWYLATQHGNLALMSRLLAYSDTEEMVVNVVHHNHDLIHYAAAYGHLDLIRLYLDSFVQSRIIRDLPYEELLDRTLKRLCAEAAVHNQVEVVRFFLKKCPEKVGMRSFRLEMARHNVMAGECDVASACLAGLPEPWLSREEIDELAIYRAIWYRRLEPVRWMHTMVEPHFRVAEAALWSIQSGSLPILRYLVKHCGQEEWLAREWVLRLCVEPFATPLRRAVMSERRQMLQYFFPPTPTPSGPKRHKILPNINWNLTHQ